MEEDSLEQWSVASGQWPAAPIVQGCLGFGVVMQFGSPAGRISGKSSGRPGGASAVT
jgi:hypothetical protein